MAVVHSNLRSFLAERIHILHLFLLTPTYSEASILIEMMVCFACKTNFRCRVDWDDANWPYLLALDRIVLPRAVNVASMACNACPIDNGKWNTLFEGNVN